MAFNHTGRLPHFPSVSHILHHGVACTVYKTWSPDFISSLATFLLCKTHNVGAYVCAICSNEYSSHIRGGGGGELNVIFYAKGKESHGSGRCWLERCRWSVPSLNLQEQSFSQIFGAISTSDSQSTLFQLPCQTHSMSLALCLSLLCSPECF